MKRKSVSNTFSQILKVFQKVCESKRAQMRLFTTTHHKSVALPSVLCALLTFIRESVARFFLSHVPSSRQSGRIVGTIQVCEEKRKIIGNYQSDLARRSLPQSIFIPNLPLHEALFLN